MQHRTLIVIVAIALLITGSGVLGMLMMERDVPAPSNQSSPSPAFPGLSAKILEVELGSDRYAAGDIVNASMLVKNDGNVTIVGVKVGVTIYVMELHSKGSNLLLKTMGDEERSRYYVVSYDTKIEPNEQKILKASVRTVKEIKGIDLAGTYRVTVTLFVSPDGENYQRVHSKVIEMELA
ncbi:MAG: hypothetical protein ACXQS2_01430 [Methermicoccaceae archaeon]